MAVFRVEKTDNYTVMSNYHLRDRSISLKAKGLLSQMLSLPPEWDYTLQGLAYINKEGKVMFNLTQRQLVCFTLAAAAGIPFYLLTKNSMGSTLSACLMIVVMLPFFFFAMYEKDGRPLEKILMNIYRQKIQRPGVRVYRTRNMYRVIQDEIYEKEVLGIESDGKAVQKGQRKAGRKKTG